MSSTEMKSYLSLIPISAKVRRRQNRMTILCIVMPIRITVRSSLRARIYTNMIYPRTQPRQPFTSESPNFFKIFPERRVLRIEDS